MKRPQFEAPKKRATGDACGRVVVIVQLRDGSNPVKGNMSRAITVPNAKVSEVAHAIEQVLGRKP